MEPLYSSTVQSSNMEDAVVVTRHFLDNDNKQYRDRARSPSATSARSLEDECWAGGVNHIMV
eukprot:359106-Chlamydomonas_euryale.AAC.3